MTRPKRRSPLTPEELTQQALVAIAKAGKKAALKAIDSIFADLQRGTTEATRRLDTARKRITKIVVEPEVIDAEEEDDE